MGKEKVGEDPLARVGVDVLVKLDEGFGLVVGQPHGRDVLELDEGDGQVRDVVGGHVEDGQTADVPKLGG